MKYPMIGIATCLMFIFGVSANSDTLSKIYVGAANVTGSGGSCPNEALEWTKKQCAGKPTCILKIDPNVICGHDIAPGERKTYSALFACEGKEGADDLKGTGSFSVSCLGEYVKIEVVK